MSPLRRGNESRLQPRKLSGLVVGFVKPEAVPQARIEPRAFGAREIAHASGPAAAGEDARAILLHGHKRADWNFGEEFARSICRQTDAAVRCWIVRHVAGVHSKIETAQAHEIRHLDMVNGGTMVAFLVSDHKLTPLRGVARPTGGASGVIDRHAVPDESNSLHRQRDFEPQLFRGRSAAEKDLRGTPMPGLRGDI